MTNSTPVRVRLRYADLDTFVERFAPNVTRGGIFLASRSPRPVGEVFVFEVQLASGQVALSGAGKVIWIKEFNPADPQKPHGMGVQFVRVDPGSRDTLNRMLKAKGGARPAGAPRATTGPLGTLSSSHRPGSVNGSSVSRAPVDTSVDLAAEYGIDEAALRRAADRHRLGSGRAAEEELDELLRPEPVEPATLAQALSELPRLLDPALRRRTGAFRTLEVIGLERSQSQPPRGEPAPGGAGDASAPDADGAKRNEPS